MTFIPFISLMMLFPLASIFLVFLNIKNQEQSGANAKAVALFTTGTLLLVSSAILLFAPFSRGGFLFRENYDWFSILTYQVGLDGVSALMLFLSTFLVFVSLMFAFQRNIVRLKEYVIAFLFLEIFLIGAFSASTLLVFYIFFEAAFVPLFFLIGVFGHENKIKAAFQFFIYSLIGSAFLLPAVLYLVQGAESAEFLTVIRYARGLPLLQQQILFGCFFIGFAIKLPIFPFHSWLPDAHEQASTSTSMVLAGILLKLGGYGLLRINLPFFPRVCQDFSPMIRWLALFSLFYAALAAFSQTNMKRMIAYSSIAHMAYVVLGLFSLDSVGRAGGVFQLFSHGLVVAGLFMAVGILYDRCRTYDISYYGGLSKNMPFLSGAFFVLVLAAAPVPGTSGFSAELLVLSGLFKASALQGAFAIFGSFLTAVYLFLLHQKIFWGAVEKAEITKIKPTFRTEKILLSILLIFILWAGLVPQEFVSFISGGRR